MEQCRGTASVFDLHVDELSDKEIHILSEPVPVLRYIHLTVAFSLFCFLEYNVNN